VSAHSGPAPDASGIPRRVDFVPDDGRVAVISNGDEGLGPDIVRRLSALGMRVVLGCRSLERGRLMIDDLGPLADHVAVRLLDVTDVDSVQALASWVAGRLRRCDVVVSNLVLGSGESREANGSVEDARKELLTNLHGTRHLAHAFAPMMRAAGYGRVVAIVAGDPVSATVAPTMYRTACCGANTLITTLAEDLVGGGILANAYCRQPGAAADPLGSAVDTPVWLATLPANGPTGRVYH
jgi:NAD(P)-dependent dehydrogenase (short-subunit alcohol dehydrogenase family)